jgi:predicted amidohydrolase
VEDTLRVACVQLTATPDKARNLERAERLVERAASGGAQLVALPEKWNGVGGPAVLQAVSEPIEGGESVEAMRSWARRFGVALVGGSITERRPGRDKFSNTSVAVDADGEVVAVYRKIHLFDVDVAGVSYRESEAEEAGDRAVVAPLAGWQVGLTVCYDVRFPELYRALALEGAHVVTVPANFTLHTGRDHWDVLLRARAIENQVYVLAPAQVGEPMAGRPSYGRSLVADPWGTVLAQAPDEETVIFADLRAARLRDVRERIPALRHRRPDAYRVPAPA